MVRLAGCSSTEISHGHLLSLHPLRRLRGIGKIAAGREVKLKFQGAREGTLSLESSSAVEFPFPNPGRGPLGVNSTVHDGAD